MREKLYTYRRRRRRLSDWAKELKIPYSVLYMRIHRTRWTVKRAFETPVGAPGERSQSVVRRGERVSSRLRLGGRDIIFLYPMPQPQGADFAEIRDLRGGRSLVPGDAFDGQPSRILDATARQLGLKNGEPVLMWIEGCFACVRVYRTSLRIKKGIEEAAYEYLARGKKGISSVSGLIDSTKHISMPWSREDSGKSKSGPRSPGPSGKRAKSTPTKDSRVE